MIGFDFVLLHDCEIEINRCFPLQSNTMITYTAEENKQKKFHLMVVNYYFTVFYDMYVWLYSPRGFLWFVLERKYAKEWGSSHENSWLKRKMLWTEHEAVQGCLFTALRPPHVELGRSSSPSADESCPLDVLQLTLLPGKPVLFLSLILWHFSTKSQGGLAAGTRRARQEGPQRPQGTGSSQQAGTHSPASPPAGSCSSCWTSLLPHTTSADLYFQGARGGCVRAHLSSLEQACSVTGGRRGHTSRDAAGPATAPRHNIHPCLAHGDNAARFTALDTDSRRMQGTGFSVKNLYVQGYIYYTHT